MHNYRKKLNEMIATGQIVLNGVMDIDIKHDNWCAAYQGRECNCDPDITVRKKA
jgi:hypothetical protein